ncbi:MAG: SDR family oxidoreductase [Spirochaetota bacterium]
MNYVLIVGAKSDIAKELAKVYAKNGFNLYLAGRNKNEIELMAKDINIRFGVKTLAKELDVTDYKTHKIFYNSLNPKPAGVIIASGYMAEQKECEKDFEKSLNTINTNFTGAVSILNIIANDMEARGDGFIVGISSVAGDRGRKTNYIYGSSKAGFTAYLSGLRNRLHSSSVKILTVKPGFVNTKMTAELDLPAKLTAEAKDVAIGIYNAQRKGKDVIYTKSIWWFIMLIIKNIPERIFKRLLI